MTAVERPTLSVEEKRQLLARLIRDRQRPQETPASFAQRQMWLAEQITAGTPVYNIFFGIRLSGPLDLAALAGAISLIVERHEPLRTTFALGQDDVVQLVSPPAPVPLPVTDLSARPEPEREAEAGRLMRAESDRVIDLATGPLLRTGILRLGPEEHVLLVTVHHIVFDAWSRAVFCRELTGNYAALRAGRTPDLPPLATDFATVARRQRGAGEQDRIGRQLAYWREQLRDLPDTAVAGSRARTGAPGWHGDRLLVKFPTALMERVVEIGRAHQATPFMILLTVFQILLHRQNGATDLSVAVPVAGRTSADVEDLIGLFVNTLVLRADLSGRPSFVDLLGQVRRTAIGAFGNQDVPLEQVVEELRPARSVGRAPFTQVVFGLYNTPEPVIELAGLTGRWVDLDVGTSKLDLQLAVGVDETAVDADSGALAGMWVYRPDRYRLADIERLNRQFLALLAAVVRDPDRCVGELWS